MAVERSRGLESATREGLKLEEAAYLVRLLILVLAAEPAAVETGVAGQLDGPAPNLFNWIRYRRNGLPSGEAADRKSGAR